MPAATDTRPPRRVPQSPSPAVQSSAGLTAEHRPCGGGVGSLVSARGTAVHRWRRRPRAPSRQGPDARSGCACSRRSARADPSMPPLTQSQVALETGPLPVRAKHMRAPCEEAAPSIRGRQGLKDPGDHNLWAADAIQPLDVVIAVCRTPPARVAPDLACSTRPYVASHVCKIAAGPRAPVEIPWSAARGGRSPPHT